MFKDCFNLVTVKFVLKFTFAANSTQEMFRSCHSLTSLDVSNFDTQQVKDMSYMFYNCESLFSIPDISKWNTNNVIDMSNMFHNCKSLYSKFQIR